MMDNQMQQKGSAIGMLLTGIAVGAVLGASAVVLSDEKKRKKLLEKVDQARGRAADMMRQAKGHAHETGSRVREGATKAEQMTS